MTTQQKGRLLGLLPQGDAEEIVKKAVEQSPPHTVDAEHGLRAILAWWEDQRSLRIAEYEKQVFPNGALRSLTNGDDVQARRKDWAVLFLLGLTHTMGRAQAEAHRGFLRQCDRDGRLDMIASSERDPSRWMKWIDDYLDRQIDESKFQKRGGLTTCGPLLVGWNGIGRTDSPLDRWVKSGHAVAERALAR